MIPGMESSFSGIGHLRDEINSKLNDKVDKFEIDSLKHKIESLQSQIERLQNQVSGLQNREGNF